MKTYEGKRSFGQCVVTVDGRVLDPRFDLRRHSPDGFEWNYGGSGPAQLALALLADHLNDDQEALNLYQRFKWTVIEALPRRGWRLLSRDIDEALQRIRNERIMAGGVA
jgi:hypothetical protein